MFYIFDGAMGTMLQDAGLPAGYCPELWNLEHPEIIASIHKKYIASGADIIETNTFGANRIKLSHYGLADKVNLLNQKGVQAARAAGGSTTRVAGSVGPTGKLISPLGDLTFDEAYAVFYEQICAFQQAGVDLIIIETIIDIQEMRAALLAAKAASDKPVICQLSFGPDGRTITGTDPEAAAITLEAMGAAVIGANCSLGPAQLLPIIEKLAKTVSCPISVQPNAGIPKLVDNKTVFPMTSEEFGIWIPMLLAAGATYIGGCCGTTPEHITAIKIAAKNTSLPLSNIERRINKYTALTSRSKTVYLGAEYPPVLIGERINPTGRKALAADISSGQFLAVKQEALEQILAGAQVLDINMGVPDIDQKQAMKQAIEELSMLVDAPLAIDTTDYLALEEGLKAYPGRALINSVSAEPERLEYFLPLAKKYGAAILCLPISPAGVPETVVERLQTVNKIIASALAAGLRPTDFVLDPLVLTVATGSTAALETINTLKLYRQHLGFPTAMGLSNVSFGLPQRNLINSAFCSIALAAGLDAPILNPYDKLMQDTISAAKALLGHDACGKDYSVRYVPLADKLAVTQEPTELLEQIRFVVARGEKEAVVPLVKKALTEGYTALEITDMSLTKAMSEVGIAFGDGHCFLPQVLLAAETMRCAFSTIKEVLPAYSVASLGTVVLATVKGDIHDLGKNIVAALLENNGFTVVDLGKDVPAAIVVQAAHEHSADIVGLCALMTTTMPEIDNTIKAMKQAGIKAHIIIGGAVVTPEYAKKVNADSYAANGVDVVMLAKNLLKKF